MVQVVIQSQLPGFGSGQSAADIDTLDEDGVITVVVPDAEVVFEGFEGNFDMSLVTTEQQKASGYDQPERCADNAALDERKNTGFVFREKKGVATRLGLDHSI